MLAITILFLIAAAAEYSPTQSCFYSQRVTFFQGNTVATPSRPAGYTFNVAWEAPQSSIINSTIFYTIAKNKRPIFLNFVANIISTTSTSGTILINPLGGSEILSITMNIVLLRYCQGTARLLTIDRSSMQLSSTLQDINFDTGVYFMGSTQKYKYEVFIRDFDGYPNNGALNYFIHTNLKPLTLNTTTHGIIIRVSNQVASDGSMFMNSIRFSYVLVDIQSFLITPIIQNHESLLLNQQSYIRLRQDFSPNSEQKCMIGIKSYIKKNTQTQYYDFSLFNQTVQNSTYTYRYQINGNNLRPSMFCIGFCKEGTGPLLNNTCSQCPQYSITCSNISFALTCKSGFYPQSMTIGIQKCFNCMPACKICLNYSYCIECETTNLPTEQNNCQKCPSNSRLAGGICSSIPGCSSAQIVGSQSVCRSCNPQQRFLMEPVGQKCVCISGYELKDSKCIDRCGDGIIYQQQCDDNNTVNRDGCSSECKQEKGYYCQRNNSDSPSKCIFIDEVSIRLISIERVSLQNRIVLLFKVLPDYLNGLFPVYMKGRLQSNLSISLGSITIEGSSISVQIAFDEDIQDKQAFFNLDFIDPSVLQRNLSFQIRFKTDQKLTHLKRVQLAKIIKYFLCSVLILAFLVLLASIPFHKMIGVETILPFQIVYFIFLLTQEKTQLFSLFQYYAGSALNFLFYFNRSSFVQLPSSENTLVSQNRTFTLIIVFCLSYTMFSISFIGLALHHMRGENQVCKGRLEKITIFWHNRVSFPFISWSLAPLLALKSMLSISKNGISFHRSLLIIQYVIMILIFFYQWRGAFSIKSSFLQSIKNSLSYIPIFLMFLLMVSWVLTASFMGIISFVEPWVLAISLLALISYIYMHPYEGALDNAGVITGLTQIVYFSIWAILRNNPQFQQQSIQLFGLFIYAILATVSIIIAVLRIIFEAIRQRRLKQKEDTKVYFSVYQNQNDAKINAKYTFGIEVRSQTKGILPQKSRILKDGFTQSTPLQNFMAIKKVQNSQLKKYLMQSIKAKKIIKDSNYD